MECLVSRKKAQGKGPWLHYDPADSNRARSGLMEFMACRCYAHNNQQSTVRVSGRDQVFAQDVCNVGYAYVARHDRRCGEGNRPCTWFNAEKSTGQVAVDLGIFDPRETCCHKHGRRRKGHVVGARIVIFPLMSSVGVVGVREREGSPRTLSDAKLTLVLSRGNQGGVREQIDR